jgi:hypothetical protein
MTHAGNHLAIVLLDFGRAARSLTRTLRHPFDTSRYGGRACPPHPPRRCLHYHRRGQIAANSSRKAGSQALRQRSKQSSTSAMIHYCSLGGYTNR